jgi:hypothetical protein
MSVRSKNTIKPTDFSKPSTVAENVGSTGKSLVVENIFDGMSQTEIAAAHLTVDGSQFKPIEFMNDGHYAQLKRANVLSDTLCRRIEAFRAVATDSQ